MKEIRKKFVGDKAFYRMVLLVAVPIMVQNGITNFVSLLDNIMVGQVGTVQMSGVAIVNQLMFVYNLCIFGGLSGAGIFGAQFYGQRNEEGLRYTFRFKLWIGVLVTLLGFLLLGGFGKELISLYLHESGETQDIAAALHYGQEYLHIMLIGLLPFMVVQIYASTLRETGETLLPMKAGIAAVLVNLVFNYLLIFGKAGFPKLGVAGAAVATVISRFVEATIVVIWTHRHKEKTSYMKGVYRSLKIPRELAWRIFVKGTPLLVNEALWSSGMAMLLQCYSVRGLSVVAGMNISNTIVNLFNVAFLAMGNAVGIIVGRLLGAGKMEEAKETDTKLIAFSVACCLVLGTIMAVTAPLFPRLYNTEELVRSYATRFIIVAAVFMPQNAFLHATYFTLRSGGKTIVTFLFDSVFMWCVSIPLAFCLARFTTLPIVPLYICCQAADVIKSVVGFILLKKGVWLNNIVH